MDEQLRIILIIIVSVSIFGLLVFVFVKYYIKNKINDDNSDQDFFSAIKLCKKKRIGPARIEDNRSLFYKKDISLLARNGFDFETSKKVMEIAKDDFIKIVKLL